MPRFVEPAGLWPHSSAAVSVRVSYLVFGGAEHARSRLAAGVIEPFDEAEPGGLGLGGAVVPVERGPRVPDRHLQRADACPSRPPTSQDKQSRTAVKRWETTYGMDRRGENCLSLISKARAQAPVRFSPRSSVAPSPRSRGQLHRAGSYRHRACFRSTSAKALAWASVWASVSGRSGR